MATVKLLSDDELSPEARAVFDDIRETRQSDFVNNFWRALAHDPKTLRRTWESVKEVMAPGALEPKVKEMLYVAGMAAETNRLVTALGVPVDDAFLVDPPQERQDL
jgi:alkylhydroperoxidase family enzyme